jgi:hypothetical protein
MKKILLFVVTAVLLTACGNPEESGNLQALLEGKTEVQGDVVSDIEVPVRTVQRVPKDEWQLMNVGNIYRIFESAGGPEVVMTTVWLDGNGHFFFCKLEGYECRSAPVKPNTYVRTDTYYIVVGPEHGVRIYWFNRIGSPIQ